MDGIYDVASLRSDQIERAYPLIQAAVPSLDLASWHRMAGNAFRREEILVAVNPRGYLQGLIIYRHFKHPALGALLDVDLALCYKVRPMSVAWPEPCSQPSKRGPKN